MKPEKERFNLNRAGDILDLAISAEMDAHQFYLRAADRVRMEKPGRPSSPWRAMKRAIASNWRESMGNSSGTTNSDIVPRPIFCIDIWKAIWTIWEL